MKQREYYLDLAFPLNDLPPVLRDMVEAITHTYSTPIEYAAVAALGIQSAILGKGIAVRNSGQIRYGNLYFVVIGGSCTGKSMALRPLIDPLFTWSKERTEEWLRDVRAPLVADRERIKAQRKEAFRSDDGENVRSAHELDVQLADIERQLRNPYQIICEDVSQEKMVELLSSTGETTFVYSPDANRTIDNLFGRMSGVASDESVFLKAFSGDPIVVHRLGREAFVREPIASMLLYTTPNQGERLIGSRNLIEGGLISRTCLVPVLASERLEIEEERALPPDVIAAYERHIYACLNYFRKSSERREVVLSPEAKRLYVSAVNSNSARNQFIPEDIRPIVRRYREITIGLALVLHVAEFEVQATERDICEEHMSSAITIANWLQEMQLGAFADIIERKVSDQSRRALEVIVSKYELNDSNLTQILPSHFTRKGKGSKMIFSNAEDAQKMLFEVTKSGFARIEDNPRGRGSAFMVGHEEVKRIKAALCT